MWRALAFLTPFGRPVDPAPAALPWFPVVGALIGLAVGAVWAGGQQIWAAPVAAAVAVLADAVLTGGLHLDGLADTADGLLPPLPRARRLEVMADPRIGAFGAAALGLALLARFAALDGMPAAVLAVAALWAGSRAAIAVVVRAVPYARPGGLATAFVAAPGAAWGRSGPLPPALVGAAVAVPLALAARGLAGLAAVAGEVLVAGGVVAVARRRLGGFTGDVLGAAVVSGETAGLLVLAVRW
jgi:adenosylcobinamide-GDP ribazoletransferase